jgi:hypothetical protein
MVVERRRQIHVGCHFEGGTGYTVRTYANEEGED